MFSTDFIFRQQENLVDNQKCQAGFRPLCNKILLSEHFAQICTHGNKPSLAFVYSLWSNKCSETETRTATQFKYLLLMSYCNLKQAALISHSMINPV